MGLLSIKFDFSNTIYTLVLLHKSISIVLLVVYAIIAIFSKSLSNILFEVVQIIRIYFDFISLVILISYAFIILSINNYESYCRNQKIKVLDTFISDHLKVWIIFISCVAILNTILLVYFSKATPTYDLTVYETFIAILLIFLLLFNYRALSISESKDIELIQKIICVNLLIFSIFLFGISSLSLVDISLFYSTQRFCFYLLNMLFIIFSIFLSLDKITFYNKFFNFSFELFAICFFLLLYTVIFYSIEKLELFIYEYWLIFIMASLIFLDYLLKKNKFKNYLIYYSILFVLLFPIIAVYLLFVLEKDYFLYSFVFSINLQSLIEPSTVILWMINTIFSPLLYELIKGYYLKHKHKTIFK